MMTRYLQGFVFATLVAGCTARGQVQYAGEADVQLVEVSPGVQVIADYDEPVFYSENYYWRWDNGVWYRSPYHTRGWVRVETVPVQVRRIDEPRRYVHYRAQGGAEVRDHRDAAPPPPSGPVVRDHRDAAPPPPAPPPAPGPAVRDHRDEAQERREEHEQAKDERKEQKEERKDQRQDAKEERKEEKQERKDDRKEQKEERKDQKKDHRH